MSAGILIIKEISLSRMRPCACSPVMPSAVVVVAVALLLLLANPPPALAKRFDCQMFCRTTGFNGMVGGCRCSFTLFTAKRAARDHNSVPEEVDPSLEDPQKDEAHYFSLAGLVRLARETHNSIPTEDSQQDSTVVDHSKVAAAAIPKNHPARLLVRTNVSSGTQKPFIRLGRSPSQMLLKRKEFEQDLDNGDTADYLRLPY
ncbi:uncharacterized protein [Cherax quadricarinatus]|uniref:uncharacterized protein isoform X1 n=1 Tax=Cherax quadricarinatus TaxID=27406 RepID=UPI00387E27B2